jgi:hypothetical protein
VCKNALVGFLAINYVVSSLLYDGIDATIDQDIDQDMALV